MSIKQCEDELISGRIVVRASGTESKIRIMVEAEEINTAKSLAERIEKVVQTIK